jgi:hypothetical protein
METEILMLWVVIGSFVGAYIVNYLLLKYIIMPRWRKTGKLFSDCEKADIAASTLFLSPVSIIFVVILSVLAVASNILDYLPNLFVEDSKR